MDILFGTYHCPDHEPEQFGLNEPTPSNYLGHMVLPLLPRKRTTQEQPEPAVALSEQTASAPEPLPCTETPEFARMR